METIHSVRPDRDAPSRELEGRIDRYARYSHHVLITGERGTGKTTIARRIHRQSPRARGEFVNLNCAGFSENLLEAELFGYERGAFTGATAAKAGLFEIASGGTLFLDEVGDLPPLLQAKLLKAVEERSIRRVGGNSERRVDARVIAATSRDLESLVRTGGFRADLFDRLNVLRLETIPLRDEPGRALTVIDEQLRREQPAVGRLAPFSIAGDARLFLASYSWPGNFREAVNLATRIAVEHSQAPEIGEREVKALLQLRPQPGPPVPAEYYSDPSNQWRERHDALGNGATGGHVSAALVRVSFAPDELDLERIYLKAASTVIRSLLPASGNSLRRTAVRLGTSHTTLSRILTRYDETRAAPDPEEEEVKAAAPAYLDDADSATAHLTRFRAAA